MEVLVNVNGQQAPAPIVAVVAVKDASDWLAISVAGRTRDATKDLTMNFSDGTAQTIYFTTVGDFAGQSARA